MTSSSESPRSPGDVALFGRDPTPGILALHPIEDAERARVRLYRRGPDGSRVEEEDDFYPFLFLSDVRLLRGFGRERFRFQELEGANYYRYLVVFERWSDHWDAFRHVRRTTGSGSGTPDEVYLIPSSSQQYLMQTGRTLFKDTEFEELRRMQIDIEVYTRAEFPHAERAEDRIVAVGLTDGTGWERVLDVRNQPEEDLLRNLVQCIRARDPDVLEGHNCFAFDFDYLRKRCRRHGVPFAVGRNGSVPRTFDSSVRFAERTVEFPALDVAGRHVVDTYFLVLSYDVFKRDLPGYGLKEAARYFDLAAEDRTYLEGDAITATWDAEPERVLDYVLDDVRETERLARHLSGSTFYLTQMLPMPYEQVARSGPAGKIEGLFVREYLREKAALPESEWGSQSQGGYTDVFVTGIVGPVVYADVDSLYPSIMLEYDVRPDGDLLELFPELLRRLTDLRSRTKRAMNETDDPEERSELDARQNSYKILINSFYGMLGFGMALFNDVSEADRVARTGQRILRRILRLIQENGRVVEADTDGVLFVPPDEVRGRAAEDRFLEGLNDEMPEGIHIGFDGRYQRMLSYKKKNYALLDYDGELTFKGSSLISRSNEQFGRTFVRRAVRLLMDEDVAGLHALYLETRERIVESRWDVEEFARTETLKDSVEEYRRAVESGKRPRAATYEIAVERAERTGHPVRKGDRITYYLTGDDPNVPAHSHARPAEEWEPADPDENTAYYLRRLGQFTRKFEPFFDDHDFRLVFSPEDLFGFDASEIEIRTIEHADRLRDRDEEEELPF